MIRGGVGGAEGRMGEGGEVFCSMQFLALIDHGGRGRPTFLCFSTVLQVRNSLPNVLHSVMFCHVLGVSVMCYALPQAPDSSVSPLATISPLINIWTFSPIFNCLGSSNT